MDQSDWVMGKETPWTSLTDVLIQPSMDLTPPFALTQSQKEDSLESQVLHGGLFKGFKRSLCQLVQYQGKVPGETLGSVSGSYPGDG